MKLRDYERERRAWDVERALLARAAAAVSAKRMCAYLSDETFAAVCKDLILNADAGSGPILKVMMDVRQARADKRAAAEVQP